MNHVASERWTNPDDETLRRLLSHSRAIAIVGLSPNPERSSHQVASYLIEKGYEVFPVNPMAQSILGRKAYPDLASIPASVDIVDVFRRPEHAPAIAKEAVAIKAKALWLQQGIVSPKAWRIATAAGLICVMDRCIALMHRLLFPNA